MNKVTRMIRIMARSMKMPIDRAFRRIGRAIGAALTVASLAIAAPTSAQTAMPPFWGVDDFNVQPDHYWRAVTERDVDAAWRLLADNHPAAVPALGDRDFTDRLARAYKLARARAQSVSSYQGYSATLAAFAAAMGDKHIWSRPTFIVGKPKWAGLAVSWRPSGYFVTDAEGAELSDLLGARLIQCDGRAAEDLARANLGEFRVQWDIEAQRGQAAPMLFVDEGNPFIQRPERCSFERNGKRVDIGLKWRRWNEADLIIRLRKAMGAGAAGFGVRQLSGGYWISVQQFLGPARQVVDAVQEQAHVIRNSSFAVLDLRGNSGGSSSFGDEIARALMGNERVSAAAPPPLKGCPPDNVWRAAPGNLEQTRLLLRELGKDNGPEFRQAFSKAIEDMEQAIRERRDLTGPAACASTANPPEPTKLPQSMMKGPLLFITDKKCFSSCLIVTEQLRRLGAFQIGQTTDANTHYVEVREQYLPSGYSTFSTLQAVDLSSPLHFGPFEPDLKYIDDISDTTALEAWVLTVALPAARTRANADQ